MKPQTAGNRQPLYIYRSTSTPWFFKSDPARTFPELFATKMENDKPGAMAIEPLVLSFGKLPDERQAEKVTHTTNWDIERDYAGLLVLTPYQIEKYGDRIRLVLADKLDASIRLCDLRPEDLNLKIAGMEFENTPALAEELSANLLVTEGRHLGEGELVYKGKDVAFHITQALREENPRLSQTVEGRSLSRKER